MSKQEHTRTVTAPSLTPVCTACFDFTRDNGQYEKRTIIIAPIVVEEKLSGLFHIAYACSRGISCHDSLCRYSIARKRKYANEEANIENLGSYGDR